MARRKQGRGLGARKRRQREARFARFVHEVRDVALTGIARAVMTMALQSGGGWP